jgi:hypothetical protein
MRKSISTRQPVAMLVVGTAGFAGSGMLLDRHQFVAFQSAIQHPPVVWYPHGWRPPSRAEGFFRNSP